MTYDKKKACSHVPYRNAVYQSAGLRGGGNEASDTADSSVLRVGFEGMTVPTNWTQDTDAHGAIQITGTEQYLCGFEVDLMKRVCEEAGLTLEPYKYEWMA